MPKLSNALDADDFQLHNVADATEDGDAPNFLQLRRRSIQLPFSWGDATPASVDPQVPANCMVLEVGIHIEVPFNGVGAALKVGDAGDDDRLLTASQVDPATAGSYGSHPSYRYTVATTVKLAITPGAGASAGRGVLTLHIQVPDY